MALTVAEIVNTRDYTPPHLFGIRASVALITGDSSYPTGGEALALVADMGLPASGATVVGAMAILVEGTEAGIQTAVYDHANDLLILQKADGTETASTDDASAVKVLVIVFYTE